MGPPARGVVWGVPGRRARPFQPLALATQQAGNTSPHRGRGPWLIKSSCLQRALTCLGSGRCAFDHSRGSPWSPALGLGRAGHCAVVAAVGPAPFFVAETGGSSESGLVEPRRNLSQDVAATSWTIVGRVRQGSRADDEGGVAPFAGIGRHLLVSRPGIGTRRSLRSINAPSIVSAVHSRSGVTHPVAGMSSSWRSQHQFLQE